MQLAYCPEVPGGVGRRAACSSAGPAHAVRPKAPGALPGQKQAKPIAAANYCERFQEFESRWCITTYPFSLINHSTLACRRISVRATKTCPWNEQNNTHKADMLFILLLQRHKGSRI